MAHETIPTTERRFERGRARQPLGAPLHVPVDDQRPPAPRRDWRSVVAAASGLNVIAGVWLIIAPWVLGRGGGDPYWNDVVFGAIVTVLAFVRSGGAFRATELSLLNAAIGVWLFISAFWLDATSTAAWNDIILGVVVFVLAVVSASASDEANDRALHRPVR